MEKELFLINKKKRKELAGEINKYYGSLFDFGEMFVLYEKNKNEFYIVSREVAENISEFDRVNKYGIFMGRKKKNHVFLSVEGCALVGKTAKKVVNITCAEKDLWFKGFDIENYNGDGFVIVKNNNDFLGCGRFEDNKILNLAFK